MPLVLFSCFVSACSAELTADSGGADDGTSGGDSSVVPRRVAISPLLRLTSVEYENTIRDLLGEGSSHSVQFPVQQIGEGGVPKNEVVSPLEAKQYQLAAEALAKGAVARLDELVPCAAKADDACAKDFIQAFGKKAFRRPLLEEELSSLETLYASTKSWGYEFPERIRVLISTILQADGFLYKGQSGSLEKVSEGQVVPLTSHEVASRLSYFLWQTMPDEELMKAADADQLKTPKEIAAQAYHMLQDARAEDTIREFFSRWLELDKLDRVTKSPSVYPDFNENLRRSMRRETENWAEHVVLRGDGSFHTLLTAPYSFIDEPLAALYGVTGPKGSPLIRTELDPTQRAGILTHASVMTLHANADQSSPIFRGKFVRERLLCDRIDAPPANLDIVVPVVDETLPTRERFKEHSNSASCAGCHVKMDPIGFGFGNYDGIGRYQTIDGGKDIDASGELTGTDVNGEFVGAVELAQILSKSEQVQACFVKQWFRYAFSRGEDEDDASSLAFSTDVFATTDSNIRELILSLTATDAFRYRKAAPGEGQNQ